MNHSVNVRKRHVEVVLDSEVADADHLVQRVLGEHERAQHQHEGSAGGVNRIRPNIHGRDDAGGDPRETADRRDDHASGMARYPRVVAHTSRSASAREKPFVPPGGPSRSAADRDSHVRLTSSDRDAVRDRPRRASATERARARR